MSESMCAISFLHSLQPSGPFRLNPSRLPCISHCLCQSLPPASLTASAIHYPLHLSLPLPLTTPCLSHCLCHSLYQYLSHWLCLSVPSLCSMPLPRTVTLPNSLCLCPTLSYCLFYSLSPAFLVASLLTSPYITVPLSAPLSPYLLLLLPLTSLPTSCRTCSLPLTLPHLRPLPIHLPLILLLPLFLHYPWLSSCCTSSPILCRYLST